MAHLIGYCCIALAIICGAGAFHYWPVGESFEGSGWSPDMLADLFGMLLEPGGRKAGVLAILALVSLLAGILLVCDPAWLAL